MRSLSLRRLLRRQQGVSYSLSFVLVLFLSMLFFGEPLTWQKLAGVALIVGGVALGSQG